MNTSIHTAPESVTADINRIFEAQQANQFKVASEKVSVRRSKLKKLLKLIMDYRPQIKEALYKDYKKHPSEVDLSEIYPITSEIKHAIKHIYHWTSKEEVDTPLAMMGSSSHIRYEPKGVVLIISPWNFPFNLTFGPLVSAIAAGNCVMIKPSEMTPHSSALMKKMIGELFDENEIALFEGGIPTSQALLDLPFNHIFFTGSPTIGKIVMTAAAKNLTSVTLELGGKSPVIIDETANVKTAARRVAWAKYMNDGQICIAPDYVLVHKSKKDEYLKLTKQYIKEFYSEDASKESSYARIVNGRHFTRIKDSVEDAINNGANVVFGAKYNEEEHYYSPTVLTNVPKDSKILTEEIFGPVMPVLEFDKLEDVIREVNSREKPLALYIYSRKKKNINYLLKNTRAGGTCINHSGAHFYNTNLPFGGSNNSGIGKSHGKVGFQEFSNGRGVFVQHVPNALELLVPPYNNFKQKLLDLTIKYF